MEETNISWTDATWNIARGCSKVDEDCKYCYMYRDSLKGTRYNPKNVERTKTTFNFPLKYKETKSKVWGGRPLIFTCSLTDVFHPEIDSYRHEMWDIIRKCPHLIFQILTKRPERIIEQLPADWGENGWDNVWLGTSVGSMAGVQRIKDLIKVPAKVRFISAEPLLEDYFFHDFASGKKYFSSQSFCNNIHWVIVGGESGNQNGQYKYRPANILWFNSAQNVVAFVKIPLFVKQLGTHIAKTLKLKDRHGRDINEFPQYLKIRQFPVIK